jgi:mitofusin 2
MWRNRLRRCRFIPVLSYGIFDYAREVRKALLASLDAAVMLAEDEAQLFTTRGVQGIKNFGEEHLPMGVERSRRVFMPEAELDKSS